MTKKGTGQRSRSAIITKNDKVSKKDKEINEYVDKLLRMSTTLQQTNPLKALDTQKEINSITNKINKLQSKCKHSIGKRTGAATIENFTKWVTDNGAELKGCEIAQFDGFDLGLKVTTEIPFSSLVIAVPRNLMMSLETAKKTDLKDLMETDQILSNMPNVALAIFLLYEKFKMESFWKPYIDILPFSYNTILYFTPGELEELIGSPTLEMALKQMKNIARQYAYFYKLFNTSDDPISIMMKDKFTYSEYCWAVSTVMTRQNTIPSENGETMMNALIPLWDMCNHTNGTISTDYNPELQRSECLALKDFKPGEQFFIFYGARTNADLFIHNGFIYDENIHDGIWIRLGISKSDPLQAKRTELLNRLGIPTAGDFFIKKGSDPVDGVLLAFLRIFNMNEGGHKIIELMKGLEQLQHWWESDRSDDLRYLECALDTTLEKKSWTFLQARLKLLLAIYKTTLEEDLKLLEGEDFGSNKMLGIRMRLIEKRILNSAIEYIDQCIKQ